jgi:hypothetical protein
MAPVLVITQKGDETSTVAGLDEMEHAPASNAENAGVGEERETSVPAAPWVRVNDMAPTAGSTVKVPAEKGPLGVVASTIETAPV